MSRSLPRLTLITSKSSLSPISSTSPTFPTDPHLPCDVARQSGGSTQIPSLTGYEPKSVEIKAIETEAIEPEDLEPRRIELGRNLGTDPYQTQDRFMRNSISEDVVQFGKVGAETSYLQSLMHDHDSAESSADSDLEDGELRKMLLSPLYGQNREDCKTISKTNCTGETCCNVTGERSKCIFNKLMLKRIHDSVFLLVIILSKRLGKTVPCYHRGREAELSCCTAPSVQRFAGL